MVLIAWAQFAKFLRFFWPTLLPVLLTIWGASALYLTSLGVQELVAWLEQRLAPV